MSSLTGYFFSALLVALVVRQVRWSVLTRGDMIRPVVIIAVVAVLFLRTIPTGGDDLALELLCTGIGLALGVGCAVTTSLRVDDATGRVAVRAGAVAVVLWVAGAVARSAFSLYADNGGGPSVVRFSVAHHLTTVDAWTSALVLMAIVEVLGRTGVLALRARRLAVAQPAGVAA